MGSSTTKLIFQLITAFLAMAAVATFPAVTHAQTATPEPLPVADEQEFTLPAGVPAVPEPYDLDSLPPVEVELESSVFYSMTTLSNFVSVARTIPLLVTRQTGYRYLIYIVLVISGASILLKLNGAFNKSDFEERASKEFTKGDM